MTSAISKRQQARNERTLQDLLKNVPGNDRCADCAAKNPGWASWNLGVFLCMRCGGLHRKLGTHVSKVKSLSMDSWSAEQVENMKQVGNVEGNKRWNPKGVRPDLPVDADEVDSAIERFIRQKYEQRGFGAGGAAPSAAVMRQNTTGSTGTGSWNEEPPPLPPKPGKKFGFSLRSASSVLPRGNKHDRNFTPPMSPAFGGSGQFGPSDPPSPVREIRPSNKPSQMFGMKITGVGNNFDAKLATLRDMGFSDNRRNSDILKSSNGSLDQAIEALVRLGEPAGKSSAEQTPGPRTLTPVSMASQGMNGLSIEKTRQAEKKPSTNPWELVESSMPQRAATQPLPEPPRSQSAQPAVMNNWNPFMSQQAPPQQQALVENFQNLQVSQTGPSATQQYNQPQAFGGVQVQYPPNTFQQSTNPWDTLNMPQQQQQQAAVDPQYGQQYQQPQMHQQQVPVAQPEQASNPFLRRAASQTFAPSNPWVQQVALVQQASNPWCQPAQQQQQQQQAPQVQQGINPFGIPYSQQPQQHNVFQQQPVQSPAPIFGQAEYFAQQQQQAQQPQQPQQPQQQPQWQTQPQQANPYQQQQQQQQLMPQQTGMSMPQQQQYQQPQPQPQEQQPWMYREVNPQPQAQAQARLDKSSILGLYGMAPQQQQQQRGLQPVLEDGGAQQQMFQQGQQQAQQTSYPQQYQQQQQPQNPNTNQFGNVPQGVRHASNESAAFVGFAGEGRHSPDAFAGLSARYV
ncbi:Protein gts1 [Friedmanniomyces endolithicus]|nr:Protein gts1 [Friedmanniomyces endolithicus]